MTQFMCPLQKERKKERKGERGRQEERSKKEEGRKHGNKEGRERRREEGRKRKEECMLTSRSHTAHYSVLRYLVNSITF